MFVYFDPDTLEPNHVVTLHDAAYDPLCNGAHFVEADGSIPLERLWLTRAADGTIGLAAKRDMPIALHASQIRLGVDAIFSDVPEGVGITVNGKRLGTMDGSGSFDLAPASTGFFVVAFSLDGYMDWSATLEVIGND